MIAGEHGPDKLYDKFRVEKVSTGQEIDQSREFIFVMRPETNDLAAQAALAQYAQACQDTYPELANQIMAQLVRIKLGIPRDPARPLPTTREGWEAERHDDIEGHRVDIQGQFANGDEYWDGLKADRYYYYCACGVCGKPRRDRRQAVLDAVAHQDAALNAR